MALCFQLARSRASAARAAAPAALERRAMEREDDGRQQRAVRGRQQVSAALVALVVEHGRIPNVDEVAARAGVSRRSVFRYFDGVSALEVETARVMRALVTERVPVPVADGSIDERLITLVRHRAELYERITPVRRFLEAAQQRGNAAFADFIADGQRLLREHLELTLRPELTTAPHLAAVLELLTSWEAWVALRDGQRRSRSAAERIVQDALRAQLMSTTAKTKTAKAKTAKTAKTKTAKTAKTAKAKTRAATATNPRRGARSRSAR